jgi:hypothetical protein
VTSSTKHLANAALSLCLLAAISLGSAQTPHQLIEPEDRAISIKGTIRLVHDFGPPGFGEDPKHDAHVSYWAIELPFRSTRLARRILLEIAHRQSA